MQVFDVTAYGAVGDFNPTTGVGTDNYAAFRSTMAAVGAAGGGVFYVPPGRYKSTVSPAADSRHGIIEPVSNTTVLFDPAASVHVAPTLTSRYFLIRIDQVHDVTVIGADLVGRNDPSLAAVHAHGILITTASHVLVRDCRVTSARHDGIYIGGGPGLPSTQVRIERTHVRSAGRNGLRVAHGRDVLITGSSFVGTGGIPEGAGVDFEPETGTVCENIRFIGNRSADNAASGVTLSDRPTQSGILLADNLVENNHTHGINCTVADVVMTGNVVRNNRATGLKLQAPNCVVAGNSFLANGTLGIDFGSVCIASVVVGNRFIANVASPFDRGYGANTLVEDNVVAA
jgi:hypothetical protein